MLNDLAIVYSFISVVIFKDIPYSLCFRLDDFYRPLVIQGDCKCSVLISISLFGEAVSYRSEKIEWKVSYACLIWRIIG